MGKLKIYEYERRADADAWIRSSRHLAKSVATLMRENPEVFVEKHTKDILGTAIWKLTESETKKYSTRYCSEAVWDNRSNLTEEVQHEHVYRKELMIRALIEDDEAKLEEIIEKAVGCVVFKSEHIKLSSVDKWDEEIDGWSRYKAAAIRVVDAMKTVDPEHPYFVEETR